MKLRLTASASLLRSTAGVAAVDLAENLRAVKLSLKNCVDMILRIFLGGLLAVAVVHAQSPSPENREQAALIALENE
jgi:hypothetical protein